MTEIAAKRNTDRCPSHPGELIADLLETNHLTKSDAAERLSISRQHLHALLAESKPVTPEMAARLGKFFGNGPGLWLRMQWMQAAYDTWRVEHEVDTRHILPLKVA